MRALGEEFRAAREARGLSLSDVSEQIHIRSVYLQALENEDWSAIGAPVYARGFIRTYARFLGLDPESAIQRFNESDSGTAPAATSPGPAARDSAGDRDERKGPSPLLYVAAALAFVLVGAVLYNFYSFQVAERNKVSAGAAPAATAAPAAPPTEAAAAVAPSAAATDLQVAASPEPTPSAKPSKTLTLKLSENSWLRVLVDGQNVMEGVFPQGTVRTFRGNKALVRIGNAGGVDVDVNGKSVGKLGNSGDVVERNFSLAGE